MQEARELDKMMAEKILGHVLFYEQNGALKEKIPGGHSRPLAPYSTDIAAAFEVVTKLGVTLIPVDEGWFALIGDRPVWASPAEFMSFLQKGDFVNAGAAVSPSAPMAVCLAAIRTLEHRLRVATEKMRESEPPDETRH
jgi:hypothetical protein